MNATRPIGLGEPELSGKLSLFQPPKSSRSEKLSQSQTPEPGQISKHPLAKRVHTTLDLTWDALQVLQEIQQQHRLKTGKVLPQWKAASLAIEGYAQAKMKSKVDTSKSSSP